MKKAEELTAARNHREAVSVLTQAKAHANAAQLKEIEEKIKAADTEMNRGSLFDLMEQEAQPEPSVQQQQPHSQQPAYTQGTGTEKSATATSATAGTAADIHAETVTADAGTGSARTAEDHNRHTRSIRNNREYGRRNNSRHSRRQDRRYSRTRNTYSGQEDSSLPNLNIPPQPEIQDWQEERFMQGRTNSNPYLSDQEHPRIQLRRTTRNTSISRSPCWNPKYSPYQTV